MPEVSTASFLEDVSRMLEAPGDVSIAVAFITSLGVAEIRPQLLRKRDCDSFRLPRDLAGENDGIITEFVRGFAVASALLTDNTSMPRNPITGLPGQMVVWLRPKQSNPRLFNELYELITRRLGLTVYRHQRFDRDPHLKIPCEEFAEVGFGIDWWDQLVSSGAEYNQAMFPRLPMRA